MLARKADREPTYAQWRRSAEAWRAIPNEEKLDRAAKKAADECRALASDLTAHPALTAERARELIAVALEHQDLQDEDGIARACLRRVDEFLSQKA